MDSKCAAKKGVVPYRCKSAEQAVVRNDDSISNLAIMTQVGIRHQETVLAHFRRCSILCRPIDRRSFPHYRPVTDSRIRCRIRIETQILRQAGNYAEAPHFRAHANAGSGFNYRMAFNASVRADAGIPLNHSEGPDFSSFSNSNIFRNNCRFVYHKLGKKIHLRVLYQIESLQCSD